MDKCNRFDIDDKLTLACVVQAGQPIRPRLAPKTLCLHRLPRMDGVFRCHRKAERFVLVGATLTETSS